MSGNDGIVWHLRIEYEDLGTAVVLRLGGRIFSGTSADLEQTLARFGPADRRPVVLDLSAVDYINGEGLRVIEAAAARLRSGDRALIVCGLSPVVRTAFDLAGALDRVAVESSPEAALQRVIS